MSSKNSQVRGGDADRNRERNSASRNRTSSTDRLSSQKAKEARRQKKLQAERKRKREKSKKIGLVIVGIEALLTAVFLVSLYLLNMLTLSIYGGIAAVLVLFVVYNFITQYTKHYRLFGKIFSVLLSMVMLVGSIYILRTLGLFSAITGNEYKTADISVYVLETSDYETISDLSGQTFGAWESADKTNTSYAVEEIQSELGSAPDVTYYADLSDMAAALYGGSVQALILNTAYVDTIEETYETFSDDTRIIATYTNRTKISVSSSNVSVTKESFNVYISGIDVYGSITQTSRSDVNIIATVNPVTKEVLLTSTPRDSYVELIADDVSAGNMDKLTHAGIHGVDSSIATLENLYDIEIDYYVRVNFSGFEDIVDALGGITIYNETAFTSNDGYYFEAGTLTLDGLHALHYARERKAFALGDVQRGINQMKVIKAMAEKAMSSTLLTNYLSILNSLEGSIDTNMTQDEIGQLVQMQISEGMPSWNIDSNYVTGTSEYRYTYSMPNTKLSVYILDEDSVAEAKEKIQAVLTGE
ncbi:MAG: LCP family protein [Lachnospiraceae bacterium]|nr:LCP family protein [Lachnospiraceae bacterium]